jgi:hypothetical protein
MEERVGEGRMRDQFNHKPARHPLDEGIFVVEQEDEVVPWVHEDIKKDIKKREEGGDV